MSFTDSYCEKRSIFKMHLSIVHKEIVDRKDKPIYRNSKKKPDAMKILQ